MTERRPDVLIAGGGLSAASPRWRLSASAGDFFLIVEQGERFGGNHIWSFFDTDLTPDERASSSGDQPHWPSHDIRFPSLSARCNRLQQRAVRPAGSRSCAPNSTRRTIGLAALLRKWRPPRHAGRGERIEAALVIDARGPVRCPGSSSAGRNSSAAPIAPAGRIMRSASHHGCRGRPAEWLSLPLFLAVQ
jgi:lycopene beta-cyclase